MAREGATAQTAPRLRLPTSGSAPSRATL